MYSIGNSYGEDERMLGAGYDNGDVKLFDLKQMKMIWEKNVKNGVCSIQFDRKNIAMNKLLVTTLESKFHVFDCRTLHPKKGFASVAEKVRKSVNLITLNSEFLTVQCSGQYLIYVW